MRRYTVTIYVDHHAVLNVHELSRRAAIRLMKQIMGSEQRQETTVRRVRTR